MSLVRKDCPECGEEALAEKGDYLCVDCRNAATIVKPMDPKVQEIVNTAISLWPGWVMIRDGRTPYDDAQETLGWVELSLVEPGTTAQGFAMATYLAAWAIWKYTGEIYRVGRDGAVEEDPTSRAQFIAALTNPHRTVV